MLRELDLSFFPYEKWLKRRQARELLRNEDLRPDEKTKSIPLRAYVEKFRKKSANDRAVIPKLMLCLINWDLKLPLEDGRRATQAWWINKAPNVGDTKIHLILFFNKDSNDSRFSRVGVATIGFRIQKNSVYVEQIQGLNYDCEDDGCEPEVEAIFDSLRWEKMMVAILIDFARENGFKKIGILASEYNRWNTGTVPGRDKLLKMRYDTTAKRMGLKKMEGRYWVKGLS